MFHAKSGILNDRQNIVNEKQDMLEANISDVFARNKTRFVEDELEKTEWENLYIIS